MWPQIPKLIHAVSGLCLLVALSTCSQKSTMESAPQDWKRVVVGDIFSFSVPRSMKEVEVQPIDSKVGTLRNETCELYYDYGKFAGDLSEYDKQAGSQTEKAQIEGREVRIVEVRDANGAQDRTYVLAAHFPSLRSSNRLTIRLSCESPKGDLGRKILRSLQFQR